MIDTDGKRIDGVSSEEEQEGMLEGDYNSCDE